MSSLRVIPMMSIDIWQATTSTGHHSSEHGYFLPLAAAPFAIIKEAMALSKSPLNTTIEVPSEGHVCPVGTFNLASYYLAPCFLRKASINPFEFLFI